MATITMPKTEYDTLKKQASLYELILRSLPERKWGVEDYSPKRIKEFISQDRLDKKKRARLKKLLSSLN